MGQPSSRPTISRYWHTKATIHSAQDSSDCHHSPTILTSTRSHVPKTLASPRRELGRTLSRAVKAAAGHRHHRCASRPMTCNGKRMPFPASRGVGIVPRLCSGHLAGAVVQPALGPAASGPAASLMKMWGVMFRALSRVSTLFIIHHSHAPDGRGHCGDRSRLEQPHLSPDSTIGNELVNVTTIIDTEQWFFVTIGIDSEWSKTNRSSHGSLYRRSHGSPKTVQM
jgi:hypothetical protein